jgi:DNA-binding MarR family transcriptional regulator
MTYQVIRDRQIAILAEKGFGDLNQPLMNVFLYPGPDRTRPSELAARINMTKQAMNYLLGQLEALGYVERRAETKNGRRLVFLTSRGWQVRSTILAAVSEVEAEWTATLGAQRFGEFMNMLRQLSSLGNAAASPVFPRRGRQDRGSERGRGSAKMAPSKRR